MLSIVIPTYNEEEALPQTLNAVKSSIAHLDGGFESEIIVVDNGSTDRTVEFAECFGARVVKESIPSIGAARNKGASVSKGDIILFIDADVCISKYALKILIEETRSSGVELGGLRAIYRPKKLSSWLICAYWDWRRERDEVPQGVAQFISRRLFFSVGGYDESLFMSEDIEFYCRARSRLRKLDGRSLILQDAVVWPSTRRYDKWSGVKFMFFQNPLISGFALRNRKFWGGWRSRTVR